MNSKIETEAKIRVSKELFYKIHKELGKSEFIAQENKFFINSQGEIIRLRFENNKIILNKKTNINTKTKFKSMNEKETIISESNIKEILSFLEFRELFSYNKQRADFRIDDCIVSLDKLENNNFFIEIEGKEKDISLIIFKLNLQDQILEDKSYLEILGGMNGLH